MNPTHDPLARILETWRVDPSPDPGFRPAVLSRIAAGSPVRDWPGYLRTHAALWTAAGLVILAAAIWTGHQAGYARNQADRSALLDTYVRNLDPRAMSRPQT